MNKLILILLSTPITYRIRIADPCIKSQAHDNKSTGGSVHSDKDICLY